MTLVYLLLGYAVFALLAAVVAFAARG